MKKLVLAKLTMEESENLQSQERLCSTYRTLLQNQFISDVEKEDIRNKFKVALEELNRLYDAITRKYNVPFLPEKKYYISPETNEILTKIFE